MQTPLTEYKKNIVSISQFGGYNHTDLTQPGEWYEMKNLSGNYAPLLTPRRSRTELVRLYAANKNSQIMYKNGKRIYTSFFTNYSAIREKYQINAYLFLFFSGFPLSPDGEGKGVGVIVTEL